MSSESETRDCLNGCSSTPTLHSKKRKRLFAKKRPCPSSKSNCKEQGQRKIPSSSTRCDASNQGEAPTAAERRPKRKEATSTSHNSASAVALIPIKRVINAPHWEPPATSVGGKVTTVPDAWEKGQRPLTNSAEHDSRLEAALKCIEAAGVTLNPNKCEFRTTTVKFLGHIIDKGGIRADPEKTSAICKMEPPQNISELRRLMGMINQLGKFSPNIAEFSQPLRELLSPKRAWVWGPDQDRAFALLKAELTLPYLLSTTRMPTRRFQPMRLHLVWVQFFFSNMATIGNPSHTLPDQ